MGGMDLSYTPEAEEFRTEIKSWLVENLPDGWFDEGFEMSDEERKEFNTEWPKRLFEGGWICATWPAEYGGKGLTTMQGVVLAEEFANAKAPMRGDFFGDTLVGPTLLQWGSEEQKKEFLPGILSGTTRWCQGFSEPNSGSDLASLKTTAVLDGDEWVINGQKVWTTQGHHADYCFLLTRTDPNAPKHAGISYILVPMRQDGIEVRGITQPDGTAEFCEVFFDNARAPKDNVVGGVNNGWKVTNTTLAFERGQSATTGYRRFAEEYRIMVEAATANGAIDDPLIRQRLMEYYTKIQILRINGLRNLSATLSGSKDMGSRDPRRDEQDVLVGDAPGGDGAGARHHRCRLDAGRRRSGGGRMAGHGGPRQAARRLSRQPDDLGVLLLPLRDDLGRHQPDPTQHRRRAGPRPPQRTPPRHRTRLTPKPPARRVLVNFLRTPARKKFTRTASTLPSTPRLARGVASSTGRPSRRSRRESLQRVRGR